TEACAMSVRIPLIEEQGRAFEVFPRPIQALLCGDLNFPATAPEHSQILAPFSSGIPNFHDVWSLLHSDTPHAPTVGIHPVDFVDHPECYDFIFITEGLTGHLRAHGIDAATEASDHQPVWVEFA
ncbi:MAG: endonuclease, partial [Pseudomonadota bacterium]